MKSDLFTLFFVLIILIFFCCPLGLAQTALTFSPLSHEILMLAGSKQEISFFLINESNNEMTLKASLFDVFQGESGIYFPIVESKEAVFFNQQISCLKWFQFKEEIFTIEPHKRKEVKAEIFVPRNASVGDYVAIVGFEIIDLGTIKSEIDNMKYLEKSNKENLMLENKGFAIATSSLVFLRVRKRGVTNQRNGKYGEIMNMEVDQDEKGIKFLATLINRGKFNIEGEGKVEVYRGSEKVNEFPLGSGRGRVLPGNKLDYITIMSKSLPPGDYIAKVKINYGGISEAQAETKFIIKEKEIIKGPTELDYKQIENPYYISVNNDLIESKIVPGSKRNITVILTNDSKDKLFINSFVEDFSFIESTNFSQHINILPDSFEILPFKNKAIKINIDVPNEIQEGNKYLKINFLPQEAEGIIISKKLQEVFGTSVFLILENVKGRKIQEISLESVIIDFLEIERGRIFPHFLIQFFNKGNIHIIPSCQIKISELQNDMNDKGAFLEKTLKTIYLSSGEQNNTVFPGMNGIFEITSKQALSQGKYQAEIVIINGEEELMKDVKVFEIK
jgi:hypothetical protein